MMIKKKIIILLGPPGAGKGTVAQYLEENNNNFIHTSLGSICRSYANKETELGLLIKSCIDKGNLIDDNIVEMLINSTLNNFIDQELKKESKLNMIIDGFPRTINQAKLFLKLYNEYYIKFDFYVIFINLTEENIENRICNRYICSNEKCDKIYSCININNNEKDICSFCKSLLYKRKDDTIEILPIRLKKYNEEEEKIINFFNNNNINFFKIDGNLSTMLIAQEINKIINLESSSYKPSNIAVYEIN
jgi:adenylate kinase